MQLLVGDSIRIGDWVHHPIYIFIREDVHSHLYLILIFAISMVADDIYVTGLVISYALFLCALAVVISAQGQRPTVSDTALEDALNDKRFIQRQLKCALGEAPCDPIGKRLKTLAPLVLRGACPQCSPQETKQIQKTLSYVQRNFPQQWAKIVRQYSG